jgi:hypothetical protein
MKHILLTILFLSSALTFSQDVSITQSDIFKDKKKHSNLSFALEDDDGGLVTIRGYYTGLMGKSLKGYYIQHFDASLKLKKELNYEVEENSIRNAFIKDGHLHLIEFNHQKKKDIIEINAVSANLGDLKFSTKQLLSFSEDNIKKFFGVGIGLIFFNNFSKFDSNHLGEVQFSPSKNFFAVNFDFKNDDKETHKVFVFDNSFNLTFEKLIEKDIKDRLFEYNDITVDDKDGTVYFLGKSYENNSKRTKKKGKANYHFELSKINKDGEKRISFKDSDKFIGALTLLNNSEKIACVGFYGDDKEFKYNGVCVYNLDPSSLEITSKKFNKFSDKFLQDKYGNKENKKKRKNKKGLKNIDFRSVFMMENGEMVVNAEEFYITTHTSMGANGSMRTYTVYHFDDIMSVRLNNDGGLKWSRNINKRQTGFTNSSYTALPVGETSYFFINCSDKVKKLSADRISFKQTSSKKSNLYLISIDGNGEFNHKKLVDDKDSKVYYQVNDGITNPSNETVILIGKKKKNTQILKVKI